MNLLAKFLLSGCMLLSICSCTPQPTEPDPEPMASATDALASWQQQKYAMFIHWGLYSLPAGIWNGEQITGYNEQIKGHAKIPTEEYHQLAAAFNPVNWDPDSVALLAKAAGMKSIVITSKHHDGFCLFESAYTEFDVVDATPYKRDIIKELAEACKRHGLKLGLYFSIIDWDFPEATPFVSTVENSDVIPPLHHAYNLNQVRELMTNYGEISEIWFDMGGPSFAQSQEMAQMVKELQPNCLISGRIWNDQGDFIVMGDNYQPDFKMGVPWQTPASMFHETWGYRSWQQRPDLDGKINEKLRDLINIVSLGGNYLLNIGPKGDGSMVPFETAVLSQIGNWLDQHGPAIYDTEPSSVPDQPWGRITAKPGKLFLHLFEPPTDSRLVVAGVHKTAAISRIYPLTQPALSLSATDTEQGMEIDLSGEMEMDPYLTVLVVEYEGRLSYTPADLVVADGAAKYVLTMENAGRYHSFSGENYQATKPSVVQLKWHLMPGRNQSVRLSFKGRGAGSQLLQLMVNDQVYAISEGTGAYTLELSDISLRQGELTEIALSVANPENPHKGLEIEALQMEIE